MHVAKLPFQRLDQSGLICGLGSEVAQLHQRLADGEIRRNDARGLVLVDPRDFLRQLAREFAQPLDIRIGLIAIGDLVLAVEKIGNGGVGARELADDVRG